MAACISHDFNHLFRLELGFYEILKTLSQRTQVYLTVPETFVYGFGFPCPTLICTDYETGEMVIKEGISQAGVYEACELFEQQSSRRGGLPIAVHKLAATIYLKDAATPMYTAQEAFGVWNKYLTQRRAQVIQRYVQAGVIRTGLIKATWDGTRVHKTFLSNCSRTTTLFPTATTKSLLRPQHLLLGKSDGIRARDMKQDNGIDGKVRHLVMLLEKYYLPSEELRIGYLEADFMKDERGVWYALDSYFISVKNFKLVQVLGFAPERPIKLVKQPSKVLTLSTSEDLPSLPPLRSQISQFSVIPKHDTSL